MRISPKNHQVHVRDGRLISSWPPQMGPPEWFIAFKTGMEARVSDLENQLEEKTDEV